MRLLDIIIVISICFMIPVNFFSQTIQQYSIAIPTLFIMYLIIFLFLKKKIKIELVIIMAILIFSFLVKGFEFGITFDDVMSLFGVLLIPIIIQIYMYRDTKFLFKCFLFMFALYELCVIIFTIQNGATLDVYNNQLIREQLAWSFPNYFAMLSIIKIAISFLLYNNKSINKHQRNISVLISLIVIMISLSRTVLIMGLFMMVFAILFKRGSKNEISKKIKALISLVILSVVALFLFDVKEDNVSSSIERTMDQRYEKWIDIWEYFKFNPVLGVGFRSTSDFLTNGVSTAHNDFLDILLKGGIIGFLLLYIYYFKQLIILFKGQRYLEVSIILAVLIGGITQNPLKFFPIIFMFSLILAESYKIKDV